MNASPMEDSGKYAERMRIILITFDWLGAFFINFMALYVFFIALMIAFKQDVSVKN